MKHPLLYMDALINEQLHPLQLARAGESITSRKAIFDTALTEATRLRSAILTESASARSEKELTAFIRNIQASCIFLANRLSVYMNESAATVPPKQAAAFHQQYASLQQTLLLTLSFIREQYAFCFNNNMPLPMVLRQSHLPELKGRLQKCIPGLEKIVAEPQLVTLLITVIRHELEPSPSQPFTYASLQYFETLFQSLEEQLARPGAGQEPAFLQTCLLYNNFNHPEFIRHTWQQLADQVDELDSPFEQVKLLRRHHNYCVSFASPTPPLYPRLPPLHKTLARLIKKEMNYGRKAANRLCASPKPATHKAAPQLVTTLSVSQLAVLVRLLSEENIIVTKNNADFLRFVAAGCQTQKATTISPESLRSKYYAPEIPALRIIKDRLLAMVTRLRSYQQSLVLFILHHFQLLR